MSINITSFNQTKEKSLEEWITKLHDLETGLNKAIKIIKVLKQSNNWSTEHLKEIDSKISELENILIPF
jgi:hypothetical protein